MAKPNLALIPATIGDKVYSILPSDGVGDFDFTRGTIATRINAQGLIETVASGENRLNYSLLDGKVVGCPHLLLEPARTNLVQYSEDFSQSYWTKSGSSIVSNNAISPDGSLNASKLVENTSNSAHRIFNGSGLSVSGNVSMSVFAKKGGRNFIRLTNNNIAGAFFDLNNGVVLGVSSGITAKIEDFGNDWYRCSITQTGVANERLIVYLSNNGIDTSYQGDGESGVYLWGAMLEVGSFPTSYIKTNGESGGVTRAAETCNGSGNAATFNDSEGVLMAEISALADDADTFRWINLSNGLTSNRVAFYYRPDINQLTYLITSNGVAQVFSTVTLSSASSFNKILAKYKQNDFSLWINGYELITDTSGNVPVGLNELSFDNAVGGDNFYGKTKQLQYFDTTDIDLEQLTSWDSFRAMAEGQLYTIE